jgi:hypothetical protein
LDELNAERQRLSQALASATKTIDDMENAAAAAATSHRQGRDDEVRLALQASLRASTSSRSRSNSPHIGAHHTRHSGRSDNHFALDDDGDDGARPGSASTWQGTSLSPSTRSLASPALVWTATAAAAAAASGVGSARDAALESLRDELREQQEAVRRLQAERGQELNAADGWARTRAHEHAMLLSQLAKAHSTIDYLRAEHALVSGVPGEQQDGSPRGVHHSTSLRASQSQTRLRSSSRQAEGGTSSSLTSSRTNTLQRSTHNVTHDILRSTMNSHFPQSSALASASASGAGHNNNAALVGPENVSHKALQLETLRWQHAAKVEVGQMTLLCGVVVLVACERSVCGWGSAAFAAALRCSIAAGATLVAEVLSFLLRPPSVFSWCSLVACAGGGVWVSQGAQFHRGAA